MRKLTDNEIMILLEADSDLDEPIEDDDEVLFEMPHVHSTDIVLGFMYVCNWDKYCSDRIPKYCQYRQNCSRTRNKQLIRENIRCIT